MNPIFTECENCDKELNDMEKQYCTKKYSETLQLHGICSNCLDKEYDGEWPAIVINPL